MRQLFLSAERSQPERMQMILSGHTLHVRGLKEKERQRVRLKTWISTGIERVHGWCIKLVVNLTGVTFRIGEILYIWLHFVLSGPHGCALWGNANTHLNGHWWWLHFLIIGMRGRQGQRMTVSNISKCCIALRMQHWRTSFFHCQCLCEECHSCKKAAFWRRVWRKKMENY